MFEFDAEVIGNSDKLIKECQKEIRPHRIGNEQVIYALPNGYELSCVNSPMLHAYPYAWEIAVFDKNGALTYDTPLTDDVEVFGSDDEANSFIIHAIQWANETK